jgi:hypothetical protein
MDLQTQATDCLKKIQEIGTNHPFISLATLAAISVPYFMYKRYVCFTIKYDINML